MNRSGQRWLERILPIAILCLAVVAVPVMIFSPEGLSRLEQLKLERERADEEISRLAQEIRELRAEVTLVRRSPEAIERVARDELGLVRKTEVVFHFEE
jgi:cell division protein FtsB